MQPEQLNWAFTIFPPAALKMMHCIVWTMLGRITRRVNRNGSSCSLPWKYEIAWFSHKPPHLLQSVRIFHLFIFFQVIHNSTRQEQALATVNKWIKSTWLRQMAVVLWARLVKSILFHYPHTQHTTQPNTTRLAYWTSILVRKRVLWGGLCGTEMASTFNAAQRQKWKDGTTESNQGFEDMCIVL